uniref:laforin-like n=1 Tax=Nyctereutes procyonoides TaxID=34880 RepID=UPI002443C9C9|nr:laforin-like [Nyctereutes procyonoides]
MAPRGTRAERGSAGRGHQRRRCSGLRLAAPGWVRGRGGGRRGRPGTGRRAGAGPRGGARERRPRRGAAEAWIRERGRRGPRGRGRRESSGSPSPPTRARGCSVRPEPGAVAPPEEGLDPKRTLLWRPVMRDPRENHAEKSQEALDS